MQNGSVEKSNTFPEIKLKLGPTLQERMAELCIYVQTEAGKQDALSRGFIIQANSVGLKITDSAGQKGILLRDGIFLCDKPLETGVQKGLENFSRTLPALR